MKAIVTKSHRIRNSLVLITSLGLSMRLIAFHFATTNSSDPITRIWTAWRWLSNPEIITHGVWGPLHFYIIGMVIAITKDPIFMPVLLNIIFSVATANLLYFFTKNEFHDEISSLIVAASYMFYPIAVRESLMATEIPPFLFFLVLSLLFLSVARQDRGSWKHALYAGISLTLAGMLRYEAWMLIPLFSLLLWNKPRYIIIFIAFSAIHPLFWSIGNYIHYGNPLYSFNWASNWNINIEGANENLGIGKIIDRIRFYPVSTLQGMTPIVAAFSLSGAILYLIRRKKGLISLIPFLGLMCFFIFATVRGSLGFEDKYTATLGTLLFPFSAEFYTLLKVSDQTTIKKLLIIFLIVGSMIFFSYPQYAIPGFNQRNDIKRVSSVINNQLKSDNEAFICDFFGWGRTHYIALLTRLHPDKIFIVPGGKYQKTDYENLSDFISHNPSGVILINKDSRFAKTLSFDGFEKVRIGSIFLTLEKIKSLTIEELELEIYCYKKANKL